MNLNTGRVSVFFQAGKTAPPATLWGAVKAGGFTPVSVEIGGVAFEGPKP